MGKKFKVLQVCFLIYSQVTSKQSVPDDPIMHFSYSYWTDGNDENKTAKGTKKCAIKRKLKFEDYKKQLNLQKRTNQPKKN